MITAHVTSAADIGVAALEYSGLSTANDAWLVDVQAQASGTTSEAATMGSRSKAAATGANELATGFYVDSGFGDALAAGSGFAGRVNMSPAPNMEFVAEDQPPGVGATRTRRWPPGRTPPGSWLPSRSNMLERPLWTEAGYVD